MFNLFKKHTPPAEPAPPPVDTPDNRPLISLIHQMKLDTLLGDMRPLHRAILQAQFLLPLHEPPRQTEQGNVMRYLTFNDDTTLCAFTDIERLRGFFADAPKPSSGVHVGFVNGEMLCRMAMQAQLPLLALNPASDAHYAMPPHVYRVLAHGYVPSSVADETLHSQQIVVARPLSGLPSEQELNAWHHVLAEQGAKSAYWFNVLLDDVREVRYAIGVECAAEQFAHLQSSLVSAWFGLWPVNTPLWVQALTSDATSDAIRNGGEPIYP